MSSVGDSVGAPTTTLATASVIDARAASSNCAQITIQGMTIRLDANAVLLADNFQLLKGLSIVSADGAQHEIRIIVLGQRPSCSSGRDIQVSSGLSVNANVTAQLYAAGNATLNGPSSLAGNVTAACLKVSGNVQLTYRGITTPGID